MKQKRIDYLTTKLNLILEIGFDALNTSDIKYNIDQTITRIKEENGLITDSETQLFMENDLLRAISDIQSLNDEDENITMVDFVWESFLEDNCDGIL